MENTEKRIKRNKDSLRHFWDNIKHTNIYIIGVPEGETREKGAENLLENIVSLGENIDRTLFDIIYSNSFFESLS